MDFGRVTVNMTTDEAIAMRVLLDRDEAKPYIRVKGELNGEPYSYTKCPVCGEVITEGSAFCRHCGQRIDSENEAL